jgi:hypothetical protein
MELFSILEYFHFTAILLLILKIDLFNLTNYEVTETRMDLYGKLGLKNR